MRTLSLLEFPLPDAFVTPADSTAAEEAVWAADPEALLLDDADGALALETAPGNEADDEFFFDLEEYE